MKNGIFKLDFGTIADVVVTAVTFAVITAAVNLVAGGFDVFTANWPVIVHNMVNIGFTAAVVSLGQGLLSTDKGSVLNLTPEITPAKNG